jgi:hypothetical protein
LETTYTILVDCDVVELQSKLDWDKKSKELGDPNQDKKSGQGTKMRLSMSCASELGTELFGEPSLLFNKSSPRHLDINV